MIIDLRVRPPCESFANLTVFGARLDAPNRPAAWVGPVAESVRKRAMPLFLRELEDAGVRHAVIWGRKVANAAASSRNEDVSALVAQDPARFSGFGGIAIPTAETVDAAVAEVETCLTTLGLKGITLEPGFAMSPTNGPDDPLLDPLYERCQALGGILAFTLSVRAGTDFRYSSPEAIDRVAARFPKMPILLGHSCWPWVAQACGVAYRRSNVYLLPDFYGIGCPGHMQWVEAANTLLADQIVFGSAYPLAAVGPMVRGYAGLPFRPEVRAKVMGGTAARLLGIESK